jgi:hypothetical protein
VTRAHVLDGGEGRDCERWCPGVSGAGHWRHHSRFHSRKRRAPNGTLGVEFDSLCRDCQQIQRNERKNEDRPYSLMRGRTADKAHRTHTSTEFFWTNMNWRALVPVVRAMMSPEGRCLSCGHAFDDEKDIQLDHIEPPRHPQDWAREHARNITPRCRNCNGSKLNKPFSQWLDEQENARVTNEAHRLNGVRPVPDRPVAQLSLFA